ncbi:hypothetical protein [Streptomyces sp. NPDC058872]|uniref:hypothetical protein n=1 Tax=Streptomyces sp. NPDC058872 TaxID=3346661 RepID=UPI003675B720
MPQPPTPAPASAPDRPGTSDLPDPPAPGGPRSEPGPTGRGSTGAPTAEVLTAGAEHPWSARRVRIGAPRPGPTARNARWFGVPLVPLFVAALVAGAFLTAPGGREGTDLADVPPGGGPIGVPSPVASDEAKPDDSAPIGGETADPSSTGTPRVPPAPGDEPTGTGPADRTGQSRDTSPPKPSRSGSDTPSKAATSSARPSSSRPSGRPVSFEDMRVGDCFDLDRDAPGTAFRRSCDAPHQAELVARPRIVVAQATEQTVREAATELCSEPLRSKAARQPVGTRWTTFVQYPYLTSYLLGSDRAACSLVVTSGTLSRPLH